MKKRFNPYITQLMNWFANNPHFIYLLMSSWIIADVYIYPFGQDIRFVLGLLLWFFATMKLKISSRVTFQAGLIIFLLMFISYWLKGTSAQTERLAVWVYLFVLFGVIKQWFEIRS